MADEDWLKRVLAEKARTAKEEADAEANAREEQQQKNERLQTNLKLEEVYEPAFEATITKLANSNVPLTQRGAEGGPVSVWHRDLGDVRGWSLRSIGFLRYEIHLVRLDNRDLCLLAFRDKSGKFYAVDETCQAPPMIIGQPSLAERYMSRALDMIPNG
jgi:hypothetical protein